MKCDVICNGSFGVRAASRILGVELTKARAKLTSQVDHYMAYV